MIAYNKTWLHNLGIRSAAGEFLDEQCITEKEYSLLEEKFPVGFYTPSFFARLGLFLFTALIVLGVLFLGFMMGGGSSIGGTCIFLALITYAALERMVNAKHYRSGVDDALIWTGAALLITGFNLITTLHGESNSLLVFLLSAWFVIRFADGGMAAVAGTSLLLWIYFFLSGAGETAKMFLPFVLQIAGILLFILTRKIEQRKKSAVYTHCLVVLQVTFLVLIYLAGNYFVIQQVKDSFSTDGEEVKSTIPLGWVFWIFTCAVPFIYVTIGIIKKDRIFLRTGLVLIAAMIFTIRYYYHVLPAELAMLIGGLILIGVSAFFLRFLKSPKGKITSVEETKKKNFPSVNLEALVIAQTFGTTHQPDSSSTQFGGGSGGGGGAGGEY